MLISSSGTKELSKSIPFSSIGLINYKINKSLIEISVTVLKNHAVLERSMSKVIWDSNPSRSDGCPISPGKT